MVLYEQLNHNTHLFGLLSFFMRTFDCPVILYDLKKSVQFIVVYPQLCTLERLAVCHKKILQIDQRSMDRVAALSIVWPRPFISRTILFCPCDDMEQAWGLRGVRLPFHEHESCQEIAVQDKEGHPDVTRGTEAVTEHLHYMGDRLVPEPATDGSIPIMDLDGQRQAEDLGDIPCQYTDSAPELPMDKRSLGGTLRLLYHLFGTGHISPVRGPFYPITDREGTARPAIRFRGA